MGRSHGAGRFAAVNSIRIFAYVPRIMKAARDKNGAAAVSSATWSLFLASHLTTIAYAVLVLGDAVMAVVFLGNAIACVGILVVTSRTCRSFKRVMVIAEGEETRAKTSAAD
jgi:hypothetical protein